MQKALKKYGPALVAAIASSLASSIATLATTKSPKKPGKSNLGDLVDRAKKSVSTAGDKKTRRRAGREREPNSTSDMEGTQSTHNAEAAPIRLT